MPRVLHLACNEALVQLDLNSHDALIRAALRLPRGFLRPGVALLVSHCVPQISLRSRLLVIGNVFC